MEGCVSPHAVKFSSVLPGILKVVKTMTTSGHADLRSVICDQKTLVENYHVVSIARTQAANGLLKWSHHESNKEIELLCLKIAEVEQLTAHILDEYASQQESFRQVFKSILKYDTSVDEIIKAIEVNSPKAEKLSKKVLSLDQADLVKIQQQTQFKHNSTKNAVIALIDAETSMHEKCLETLEVKRKLVDVLIPGNVPTRKHHVHTSEMAECDKKIEDLAARLQLAKPVVEINFTKKTSALEEGTRLFKSLLPSPKNNCKATQPATRKFHRCFSESSCDTMGRRPPPNMPTVITGSDSESENTYDYVSPPLVAPRSTSSITKNQRAIKQRHRHSTPAEYLEILPAKNDDISSDDDDDDDGDDGDGGGDIYDDYTHLERTVAEKKDEQYRYITCKISNGHKRD